MGARLTNIQGGTRLDQLRALAQVLAEELDNCTSSLAMPPLAKQYRETLREIEEIEGVQSSGDEISEMLAQREAAGKPGALRAHRAGLPQQ